MMRAMQRLLALALALSGCSIEKTTADYLTAGNHGIGVHTFTFVDTSRATPQNGSYGGAPSRTLVVEVWYPSPPPGGPTTDAPLDRGGPFPLILQSHGFMDNRRGEGYLAEHLASRGYIVAAPDYPLSNGGAPGGPTIADVPEQPGDFKFVIDELLDDTSTVLSGAIDAQHIAASGLSLGGLTTLLAAFHPTLRDPRVRAAFALAAPSCFLTAPFYQSAQVPLMLVHGDADLIVPVAENSERAIGLASDPRELILLARGSHTGFAGVATLLDPSMNYDRLGCSQLAGKTDVTSFAALGTEAQGISADPSVCPMPCTATPMDPSLVADRQHDLTNVIAAAFFDSNLRNDGEAHSFLQKRVADENNELAIRTR
jgi:predicted dienelactone hydrolase